MVNLKLLAFIGVVLVGTAMSQEDCWWTGCQLNSWAVVGCDHYGRVEKGRKPCNGGNKYKCCLGGGGGGEEGGDDGDAWDEWGTNSQDEQFDDSFRRRR